MPSKQPRLLKLCYKEGPRHLHIALDEVVFWIDGIQKYFHTRLNSELVAVVARHHPQTLPLAALFEELQKVQRFGSKDAKDRAVHKIVHSTRSDLKKAGLVLPVITNARGIGYRLAEGWSIEQEVDSERLMEAELEDLRALVGRCIRHLDETNVFKSHAGLLYFEAAPHVVLENFALINGIGWKMLHCVSEPDSVPDLLDVKNDLSSLMTYVVFWRVGHRLTEQMWRDDYRAEISKVLGDIEMRVEKLKRAVSTPRSR